MRKKNYNEKNCEEINIVMKFCVMLKKMKKIVMKNDLIVKKKIRISNCDQIQNSNKDKI